MKSILVVNGSHDWRPHFPGYRVHQTQLQRSKWLLERGRLTVIDRHGHHRPDGVLWRLGAIEPSPMHLAALQMLRLSKTPCVNPAQALSRGYDRLSMLAELSEAGLPVIELCALTGKDALELVGVDPPVVIKVGNLHGGMGKARAMDSAQWQELCTLAALDSSYATIEPYLEYVRDIRCLAVRDEVWAMSRRGQGWRANVDTESYELIEPPEQMKRWTSRALEHFGADVLGLDFLELHDGRIVLLESNDIPGILGFGPEVPQAIARCLRQRIGDAR